LLLGPVDRIKEIERQAVVGIPAPHADVGAAFAAENLREDVVGVGEVREAGIVAVRMRRAAVGEVAIVALLWPLLACGIDLAAIEPPSFVSVADDFVGR